jgi:hypothetical protein
MSQTGPQHGKRSASDLVRWRMQWYPRAVLAALGAALLLGVLFGGGASTASGRLGGDYPAFYGAGRIAVDGDWKHLYEPERQIDAQYDLYPGEEAGQYMYFPYPPFVAAAYAPLALLPYRLSFLAHTLLMTAAVVASVWIAGARFPILREYQAMALALALTFYPMLRAILGGQNSALTLFLIVASWRLATDRHDFAAGLVLALLLFKPQYAVPLMLLYALTGRWRVLLGSLTGAGVLLLVGASVMGIDWLVPWWKQVQEFAGLDVSFNGMNNVSFIGFAANLSGSTAVIVFLGFVPALAAVAVLASCWLNGRSDALGEKMALAATGLILISPHTLYYDGSLVLITLVVLAAHTSPSLRRIAFIWVAASCQVLADVLGWSPFFFVVLGIAVWAMRSLVPDLFQRRQTLSNPAMD